MSKKRAEYQKSTSCCHKAWLICGRRRRERPDFFHQGEAQRNILTISGIEQVRDAMRGHFILLEVEVDERWGSVAGGSSRTFLHDELLYKILLRLLRVG